MAASENQEVNFEYGFELRGDRQVERSLDSIIERFARTGSAAEAAGVALEKTGRIFEVGLPIGLAAAGIGLLTDKLSEAYTKENELSESLSKLAEVNVGDATVKELATDVTKLSQMQDELEKKSGLIHSILFGSYDETEAKSLLDKFTQVKSAKEASEINFQTSQSSLEAQGPQGKYQALLDKINHDSDAKIAELTNEGHRSERVAVRASIGGRTGTRMETHELPNVNSPQIAAEERLRTQRLANARTTDSPDAENTKKLDAARAAQRMDEIARGHEESERKYSRAVDAFLKGNDTDAKIKNEQHEKALNKYKEDQGKLNELNERHSQLEEKGSPNGMVVSRGGFGLYSAGGFLGTAHKSSNAALEKNTESINKLTAEMGQLVSRSGLTTQELQATPTF